MTTIIQMLALFGIGLWFLFGVFVGMIIERERTRARIMKREMETIKQEVSRKKR
jgi:uncharacterized protein YneF (UPF0154 family)